MSQLVGAKMLEAKGILGRIAKEGGRIWVLESHTESYTNYLRLEFMITAVEITKRF